MPESPPSALTVILLLPILGAVLVCLFRPEQEKQIKTTALFFAVITFCASLFLLIIKASEHPLAGGAFSAFEYVPLLKNPNISYSLGVDGISIWLVILTTFLTPVVMLASYRSIKKHVREYVIAFLVLETAMVGALVALDLVVFYVFFELMLIPMYLIIGVWGHDRRIYAAIKFFLYTLAGSLLLLIGLIYLYTRMPDGERAFHLTQMLANPELAGLSPNEQFWLFFCFALAFAIKVPLFPFHTWLPDAHVEAPTGGSVILAAILLKVGTYGMLRFALPLFPYGAWSWAPVLMVLAVIGIIFGAWMAWVQTDMKKLVAYSSVSHLGFSVLGIFAGIAALSPEAVASGIADGAAELAAISGSVYTQISHGLTTGALFLIVGLLYDRKHTREISEYGGIAKVTPKLAVAMMIATLGAVGLPGTSGFVGEFLVLIGAWQADGAFDLLFFRLPFNWFVIIGVAGVMFGAVYMLSMYRRVFFGPLTSESNARLKDLSGLERLYLTPVLVAVIVLGVFPNLFLAPINEACKRTQDYYLARMAVFVDAHPEVLPKVSSTAEQSGDADDAGRPLAAGSSAKPASRGYAADRDVGDRLPMSAPDATAETQGVEPTTTHGANAPP